MGLHPLPTHVKKCVETQFLTALIQKFDLFFTLWFQFLRFGIWSVSVCLSVYLIDASSRLNVSTNTYMAFGVKI